MSNTHTVYCDKCRVKHWAGQSDYLYSTAVKFLHEHLGHALRFQIDGCEADDDFDFQVIEYPMNARLEAQEAPAPRQCPGQTPYGEATCGACLEAQEAPVDPPTITLNFERPRMWHMGCKVSHLGGNVCKTISHDPANSLVECRACGKRGRYPVGAVGERVVAEEPSVPAQTGIDRQAPRGRRKILMSTGMIDVTPEPAAKDPAQ